MNKFTTNYDVVFYLLSHFLKIQGLHKGIVLWFQSIIFVLYLQICHMFILVSL